jgi:hypothetical protein
MQVDELLLRNVDAEGTNFGIGRGGLAMGLGHRGLLSLDSSITSEPTKGALQERCIELRQEALKTPR